MKELEAYTKHAKIGEKAECIKVFIAKTVPVYQRKEAEVTRYNIRTEAATETQKRDRTLVVC